MHEYDIDALTRPAALLDQVIGSNEGVTITKDGIPVVVVLPIDEYEHLIRLADAYRREVATDVG